MAKTYQHQLFRARRLFLAAGAEPPSGLDQWTVYYASQMTEREGSDLRRVVGCKQDVTESFLVILRALVAEVLSDCTAYDSPDGREFFSVQEVLDAFGIARSEDGDPLVVLQQEADAPGGLN